MFLLPVNLHHARMNQPLSAFGAVLAEVRTLWEAVDCVGGLLP